MVREGCYDAMHSHHHSCSYCYMWLPYLSSHSTDRYCNKTTVINGVTIPKDATIIVPITLLHHSPLYWKDPDKFDPDRSVWWYNNCFFSELVMFSYLSVYLFDRFTAEERAKRPQLCHMPFSFGPRSCLAMRLALLEAKIALIELLKRYTFIRAPETEVGRLQHAPVQCCILKVSLGMNLLIHRDVRH